MSFIVGLNQFLSANEGKEIYLLTTGGVINGKFIKGDEHGLIFGAVYYNDEPNSHIDRTKEFTIDRDNVIGYGK